MNCGADFRKDHKQYIYIRICDFVFICDNILNCKRESRFSIDIIYKNNNLKLSGSKTWMYDVIKS